MKKDCTTTGMSMSPSSNPRSRGDALASMMARWNSALISCTWAACAQRVEALVA